MFSHFLRKVFPFPWRSATTAALRTRIDGRIWDLTPEATSILGPDGPELERWITDPTTVVVKTGPYRTVYRVSLPGGTIYLKHCRISGFRAWAREVLRPPKARLEFENALELHARGVAAVLPLAWGATTSRWPGDSYLITHGRTGVVPFVHFLEVDLPRLAQTRQTHIRRHVAVALGEFMAVTHDAGVAHPDPHPGNLLVELDDSDTPWFFLIDLHAVRLGGPMTWAQSRANLVLYNRWFQLRSSHADRLRFWRSYWRHRRTLTMPALNPIREVERRTVVSNLRFWAGRERRCLGSNRYFRRIAAAGVRGHAVRDLPETLVRDLLSDPDAFFSRPGVIVLKDSPSSTVVELVLPLAAGSESVVLKRVFVRNRLDPLKNLLRASPVLRSWRAGHALRDRLLPTPRPLAVVHRTRGGVALAGYLLTTKVANPIPLSELATDRVTLQQLARTIRSMHDRGVSNRDMKAANILIDHGNPEEPQPTFIDLVGVRTNVIVSIRRRARELARLNASFLTSPDVTNSVRLRFLHTYLASGPRFEVGWKSWWRAVSRETAAKVNKNRRSGRKLG